MTRIYNILLQGALLLALVPALAQDTYTFRDALFVASPQRYGREAIYTDALAYRLYANELKPPKDGEVFSDTLTWRAVTADSARRLFRRGGGRGSFGRGGYFYLTYQSDKAQTALLNIRGNSGLYINGEPHTGDPYNSGWLYIPVQLKKGLNELYVRGTMITASLSFPGKPVQLQAADATLPSIVTGRGDAQLQGALVVINSASAEMRKLRLKAVIGGRETLTDVPAVPKYSSRKVPFTFDPAGVTAPGKVECTVSLLEGDRLLDEAKVSIEAVSPAEKYSNTFISAIDGSLQYYAVAPQAGGSRKGSALFLSVHGAGVEAIGQARAYQSKDWGTLVAATNRRPRGFNWEDWGRMDALEVLALARRSFEPDPQRIYLTGHSMGGHGTWFLGATYPANWAAIAPSAGYPTLKGYGSADGLVPDGSNDPMEKMLLRAGNQSDVIRLAENYKPLGVYVFHGDADRVVPVTYARQMREVLAKFHPDFSYCEYPGGEHWFGDISVDWQPIFDFFHWRRRPADSAVNVIDFTTANPGISEAYRWATVYQQKQALHYSRIRLKRDRAAGIIEGQTENVRLLRLDVSEFTGKKLTLKLDGSELQHTASAQPLFLLRTETGWQPAPVPARSEKGPHRYGTLKDAFNHRMLFVYSTGGTAEENEWSFNKARYDAETWYYRGNGAIDIIADKDYDLKKYPGRGVILYGNQSTNKAWNTLLSGAPIQVQRNRITAGGKTWTGPDMSASFVWPLPGSEKASVAVIGGTGIMGMKAAYANQYFAGASGFPDYMIYNTGMLLSGAKGVKMAGFFDHAWRLTDADRIVAE
ncbi:carboxylesterase family protein [Chitinophaga rhizosphaerae]|uniref:carboxylesterase family protein n=1 Tax=Chitinophaga rhizosphaerae TaxID=1864947 RepID=UPI000F807BBE|nr:alpha/beta hydrolase-fold protein [Chitinophaga rhizosphaerae]